MTFAQFVTCTASNLLLLFPWFYFFFFFSSLSHHLNRPFRQILKALDDEFHQLQNNGDFIKAEYVQGLWSWKSKQTTTKTSTTATTTAATEGGEGGDTVMSRAALKYLDACAIDSTTKEFVREGGR